MHVEQENFREPNAVNPNVASCAILELCPFKSEKRLFLTQKWHFHLSKLNESSIWLWNLLVGQESFKESNSVNGNVRSFPVLKLSLLTFGKKAVFNSKITLSLDKTKRIRYIVPKFAHWTRKKANRILYIITSDLVSFWSYLYFNFEKRLFLGQKWNY